MDRRPKYKIKIVKLLEYSIGENIGALRYGYGFLEDIIPKTQPMKNINHKLDFIKIKNAVGKTLSTK